jgi:hypothetical protein
MLDIEVRDFFSRGFVISKSVIKQDGIKILTDEIDAVIKGESKYKWEKLKVLQDTNNINNYTKIENIQTHQIFKMFLDYPVFKKTISEIYGGIETKYYSPVIRNLFLKRQGLDWHQDRYPTCKVTPLLAVLVAIDPLEVDGGALEVVPFSHADGQIESFNAGVLNDEQVKEYCDIRKTLELEPGDAIFYNPQLIHRFSTNCTRKKKRFFQSYYVESNKK